MTNHADGTDRTHDPTSTDHDNGADWRQEAESALADVTGALHAAWDSSRQARVEALEAARGALLHLGTAVDQAASAARAAWDDREDDDETPRVAHERVAHERVTRGRLGHVAGRTTGGGNVMTARVVVGVDGSENAEQALEAAVAQARAHHATLEVVHAWMPAVSVQLPDYVEVAEQREVREAAAYELMKDVVATLPDDLPVEWRIEEGSPPAVLLERAQGAQLLVVGARGRGGFIGLLLGSTSTQVATHAPCPVLVVRADDAA